MLPATTVQAQYLAKLTGSDAAVEDHFGGTQGIAISDNTIIVGASYNDEAGGNSGAAYVFELGQGGPRDWEEVVKLIASDAARSDHFGETVAISGDTAIVGASFNDDAGTISGSAYVFKRGHGGANNWGEVRKLTASDAAAGHTFGSSVGVSNDTVIVGSKDSNALGVSSGAACVFERNRGETDNWGEVVKLTASDGEKNDLFGWSVGVSGDVAIVGTWLEGRQGVGDLGAAYVFERNHGGAENWGEVAKLTASDAAVGDEFGLGVAISGDFAIVGASDNDDDGAISGSAYIFERNQGGASNWGEVAKLTASDATADAWFGWGVAISGDIAVVGAPNHGDTDPGVAYDYDGTGAAYVFGRNEGGPNNWGEIMKLTAPDTALGNFLGAGVGISGRTAVAGAPFNNGHGAACVFHVPEPPSAAFALVSLLTFVGYGRWPKKQPT